MPDVVSRGRDDIGEPAEHRAARRVESIPLGLVGQRRNGDGLTLVEAGEGGVDHIFGRHHASRAQIAYRTPGDVPEFRRRRPGQDGLDAHALARELVIERVAEGQKEALLPLRSAAIVSTDRPVPSFRRCANAVLFVSVALMFRSSVDDHWASVTEL
jgi:hypothetical protein